MFSWFKLNPTHIFLSGLQGCPLSVFIALCSRLEENGTATASNGWIANMTNYNRRSVIRAVNTLERTGFLERIICPGPSQALTVRILRSAAVGSTNIPNPPDPVPSALQGGPPL